MMDFRTCIHSSAGILMEGALGERLKREYGIRFDPFLDMGALVYSRDGRTALEKLWVEYAHIAHCWQLPFLATTATRRTNRERLARTAFSDRIIEDNVNFLREVQKKQPSRMYVGGLAGCRGDAYTGLGAMGEEDSYEFHSWETERFAAAGIDFLYAALMPTLPEAAGMSRAIAQTGVLYLLSFTITASGCLVDGTPISEAIRYIDRVASEPPVCYMTNCVHPRILRAALESPVNDREVLRQRFLGLQANASSLSFAELDGSTIPYTSDPVELAEEMAALRQLLPLKIFGGCCGTDHRHMEEIARRIVGDHGKRNG